MTTAEATVELTRIEIASQLRDELHARAYPLAVLGEPEAVGRLDTDRVAERIAAQLAEAIDAGDDRLLAETVIDVMCALWPTEDPPPEWWQSPVGRTCAHSVGDTDHTDAVTQSVAAAMLGLAVGSIGPMIARGDLDRGQDGGVTVASIKRRITRRRRTRKNDPAEAGPHIAPSIVVGSVAGHDQVTAPHGDGHPHGDETGHAAVPGKDVGQGSRVVQIQSTVPLFPGPVLPISETTPPLLTQFSRRIPERAT